MKKVYVLAMLMSVSFLGIAQTLVPLNVTTTVYGLPNDPQLASALIDVQNTDVNDLDVGVERLEQYIVPGSANSFCWGILCYPATTSISLYPQNIPAGTIDNTFRGDYLPNGTTGISVINYKFYDVNDPFSGTGPDMSNSVTVTINYDTQTLGIDNINSQSSFLNVASRPGNSLMAIAYNVAGNSNNQLKLYNLLGNSVKSFNLNKNGTMVVSTSGLSNGVYVFCLEANGKKVATKKVVVSK